MALALNRHIARGAVVGALGGLLFGFDTAVISGTTDALVHTFHLSAHELGLTVAIALVGTVLGAMVAGPLESQYGGRNMLRVMAVLYLFSALGCALAPSWMALLVSRFIGGIGIGGSSVLGPVYIAEIAPARLRGRLVGMFQINIVIGVLAAYFSNYMISRAGVGSAEWRWDFGVASGPALLFLLLLFGIPNSARWLIAKGRHEEAVVALQVMCTENARRELQVIAESIKEDSLNSRETLFQWKYRRPIFLAVTLAMFNQLTGINAITYYLNDIFGYAGFNKMSGGLQAVAFGGMNLTATFVGMALIDGLGRKTLLLIGSVGSGLALVGVSVVFALRSHREWLLPLLVFYIFFFAISQGSVIWVYLSEIFPTRVRGKGQALGSTTHWLMNALISYSFPVIAQWSGAVPFAFFACMMVVQFVVVMSLYPETKNVSLEQMQHMMGIEAAQPEAHVAHTPQAG
jgi:MFS transporter, SP family, arabinose:H+ symporter